MALSFKLESMSPKDLLSLTVDGASERELSTSWVDCESLRVSLHDGVPNLMTQLLTIAILGVITQKELSQSYQGFSNSIENRIKVWLCLERRPHLAVQVCVVSDHPCDHLPGQRVLREPAQVGHGHGRDDDKYGVQVGHDDNEYSDTEGTAFVKEPDGWEVFKDRGSVVHIFDSQANLVNNKLLNCPI